MFVQRNVSTKPDSDSDAKITSLRVEFPDGTLPWLAEGFLAYLVVKLQGMWRKKGIPAKYECRAVDHAPGVRIQLTPEQAFALMSVEEKKRFLREQMAILEGVEDDAAE